MYLCEVDEEKPGVKTYEDLNIVTIETEPLVYPDEGNVLLLHFYSSVVIFFKIVIPF